MEFKFRSAFFSVPVFKNFKLQFLSQYKLIPAKVVDNSVHKPENLMTIDKGRADGVEVDMGVACGNGVVGIVYLVGDHYSVVIPVLNVSSSRISCAIRDRGYFGYLHWYGGDPTVAYVEDIPRHAKFRLGEWVVTSGFSSIFPPDIPLGVAGEAKVINGATNEIKVKLLQDFTALRYVTVVYNTERPEMEALTNED